MNISWLSVGLLLIVSADVQGLRTKRVLPTNKNCDPQNEVCRKGDWVATRIADCKRTGFFTCDAQNDVFYSWTVDVAEGGGCQPVGGLRFTCGSAGTNTRCVCSDYKFYLNECRCQYWPEEDPGASQPAFCTGYYTGGTSNVHHWACCDNCDDPTNTCDRTTWQGGSSESYCSSCGVNTGGGRVKYYFNCGSCSQQGECEDYCSGPIRNLPGLCWQWLDCFKGCCLARAQQPRNKRQIETMTFCGDGTCSSNETPTTCPIDCCYQVNPDCSKNHTSICENNCCGDPSCCRTEEGNTAKAISATTSYMAILAILTKVLSF